MDNTTDPKMMRHQKIVVTPSDRPMVRFRFGSLAKPADFTPKNKEVVGLEKEAKKSKVQLPEFVNIKCEPEVMCESKAPQEQVIVKYEPDVLCESAALQESVAVMEEVDDGILEEYFSDDEFDLLENADIIEEKGVPKLVPGDYPITKLPPSLSKPALKVFLPLIQKHKVDPQSKLPLIKRVKCLVKTMKKQHPIHENLSKMSLNELRGIHNFAIQDIFIRADMSAFIASARFRKRIANHYFKRHRKSPLTSLLKDKEASQDPLAIQIHDDILNENTTNDHNNLGSFFDVIANIKPNKVKALIWYGGDHSIVDYSSKEARAKLAKLCLQAKPESPLSHVISLEIKYNCEVGRGYKEALKEHGTFSSQSYNYIYRKYRKK